MKKNEKRKNKEKKSFESDENICHVKQKWNTKAFCDLRTTTMFPIWNSLLLWWHWLSWTSSAMVWMFLIFIKTSWTQIKCLPQLGSLQLLHTPLEKASIASLYRAVIFHWPNHRLTRWYLWAMSTTDISFLAMMTTWMTYVATRHVL